MEEIVCNLCGTVTSVVYQAALPDLLLERPDVLTTFVRCTGCGLVYQNPRPTMAEMGAHYPDTYESYNLDRDEAQRSWLMQRAIQYGLDKRARAVLRTHRQGTLLDVGCSTGIFLRSMSRVAGWELHGVEISDQAAGIACRIPGTTIFTGTLEEAAYTPGSFDAVTLWDVFEHLHDPAGSLQEIRRILKPDGVVVIRVPNLSSTDARLFGRYWAGLDAPRHLWLFDRETLPRMLQQNGFAVSRMDCSIGSYPTFILSVRFWLYGKGIPVERRERIGRILSHPLARLTTAPFFRLYGAGLRGPLLTLTARPLPG